MNKRRDNVPFDPYYFEKRASNGITFSLGDTFRHIYETNHWITTGDWRLLNLEKPPFNFPKPLQLLNEQCSEGGYQFRDKSLGLWRVQDIHI
jgi:hypothetical protein